MFKDVVIKPHERGLRFRHGNFIALLPPGRHTVFTPSWDAAHERVEVVDTRKMRLEHPQLDELLGDYELRMELVVADVAEGQRALVFKDGQLYAIAAPGRHAYWKAAGNFEVEIYHDSYPRMAHRRVQEIVEHRDSEQWFEGQEISGGGLVGVSNA